MLRWEQVSIYTADALEETVFGPHRRWNVYEGSKAYAGGSLRLPPQPDHATETLHRLRSVSDAFYCASSCPLFLLLEVEHRILAAIRPSRYGALGLYA